MTEFGVLVFLISLPMEACQDPVVVGVHADGTPLLVCEIDVQEAPERDAFSAERGGGDPPPTWKTAVEEVLDKAAHAPAGSSVRVALELIFPAPDLHILHGLEPPERELIIAGYREDAETWRGPFADRLAAIGAETVGLFWLTSTVIAEIPAKHVADVVGWTTVVSASPAPDEPPRAEWGYEGKQLKDALLISQAQSWGYDASQYGRQDSGAVRVGILEPKENTNGTVNLLYTGHVGWRDCPGCASRIVKNVQCGDAHCQLGNPAAGATDHGTVVTWVAAGSIQEGQDSNFPGTNTADQRKRSGVARESRIYYYRMMTGCGMTRGLEQAIEDGVDVLNISAGYSDDPCNAAKDVCSFNSALRQAMDAGLLVVASAGNLGEQNGCSVTYPSYRPEVVEVSGLDTFWGTAYNETTLHGSSSKGPLPITVAGHQRSHSSITVAAPYCISHNFKFPSGYQDGPFDVWCGTSFSAPSVAGSAATFRRVLAALGFTWAQTDARRLFVSLAVSADRWYGPGAYTQANNETSIRSGFGRLKAHFPRSGYLPSPWAWSSSFATVSQGGTTSFNIPIPDAGPQSWKFAMTWYDEDLTNASDITVTVRNTCPPGGGTVDLLSDLSFNLTKRLVLSLDGAECLQVRLRGWHVVGGSKPVYYAWYRWAGGLGAH